MPRLPSETESNFQLGKIIKTQALQIELEKYRCAKIKSLAAKAKNNNELRKAKVCYRAWGLRMALVSNLQKEHKRLIIELEKQNKNVVSLNGKTKGLTETKSLSHAKAKAKSKSLNLVGSQLKEVC